MLNLADYRWDIPGFARDVLGIELHPGQVRIANAVTMRDASRWRARYLTICVSSGNRAGKTLIVAIIVLWATLYKIGQRPPAPNDEKGLRRWLAQRYWWFHFGITQEIAELVHGEIAAIKAGTHQAQRNGCPIVEEFGKAVLEVEGRTKQGYAQVRWAKTLGGGEIAFRSTAEKALGSLGRDMNGVSFDECGFEPNLSFIVNEVLHMRRLSTGGQLLMTSTPTEGLTQFADEWSKGDPDNPLALGDNTSLRMSTRDNVGYGIDHQTFERLIATVPEHLVAQNIDGHFIEGARAFFNAQAVDRCFQEGLPTMAPPEARHRYVQGVDPALTYDACWSITVDRDDPTGVVTGVNAQRKTGKQTVNSVSSMVRDTHEFYNAESAKCDTGLDVSGFGGKVFRDLFSDLHGIRSVEFGGTRTRKFMLLTDLKGFIEQGRIRFPRQGIWLELRRQLLGYRLDDRSIRQDAVMALAVVVRVIVRYGATGPNDMADLPFDFWSDNPPPLPPQGPRGIGPRSTANTPVSTAEVSRRKPTHTLEGLFGDHTI